MLTLTSIHASIGGSRILRGVDLTVPDGQLCCLMGRNGVGKTSTLRSIVGLFKTDSGKITLEGKDITKLAPEDRARQGLAYVPQGRDIFPFLTVEENLLLGATARGIKTNGKLDRIFTLFPIIKEFLPRKGGMLSGGQQQQLAIARALLTEPKVLILDEPTEGIQPNVIDQIGDALKILRTEDKMSILLVEQYLDFCRELADVFYIMDRGTVVAEGGVKDLTDAVVKEFLTV